MCIYLSVFVFFWPEERTEMMLIYSGDRDVKISNGVYIDIYDEYEFWGRYKHPIVAEANHARAMKSQK